MLLHLSAGLITALVAHHTFGAEMNWSLCIIAVLAAYLPDIDALSEWRKKGKVAAHSGNVCDSRDGLHYPTITTPSVFVIVAATVYSWTEDWSQTWFWAVLVAANVFIHFVIDSFGPGWGVKWLFIPHAPKTWSNYKLFCDRDGTPSLRVLMSWKHTEIKQVIFMHGDKDWLQKYFQSTLFLLEYVILMLTVAAVLAAFSNASLIE